MSGTHTMLSAYYDVLVKFYTLPIIANTVIETLPLISLLLCCYSDEVGVMKRPVIIHRAILGSVERMMAILTENCAGKW